MLILPEQPNDANKASDDYFLLRLAQIISVSQAFPEAYKSERMNADEQRKMIDDIIVNMV